MARESFFYPETNELFALLDEAASRSSVSRGQAFEDFLQMTVCTLAGGTMEEEYLQTVRKHTTGERGKRGCDILARLFGELVARSEETREDVKDLLGDLFQGAITYGEAGQFLTPMSVCRAMAQVTLSDLTAEDAAERRSICDPCCGSGRMLLAVAETHRHWTFTGQDVDLRCVRMTAINLALRNLYGYVIHGNSLADKQRLVYRTGFNLRGFIRQVPLTECPPPVQQGAKPTAPPAPMHDPATINSPPNDGMSKPKSQLFLF